MSDLKQYVQDAIRTESKIESVNVGHRNLLGAMKIFVAAGNMLDAIKKNVFYGKEIHQEKWNQYLTSVEEEAVFLDLYTEPETPSPLNIDPRLFHALIGIATESTELIEAIIKAIDNEVDIDHVNVREELGDLNWYQAIAVDASGADWDNILDVNIAKLKKRYPEKFTADAAINRDTQAERLILEGTDQRHFYDWEID